MKKLVVIDADSIVWTVAYKFRDKKMKNFVIAALNKFVEDILYKTEATSYLGFYGSDAEDRKPNFRYALDSEYKANRPTPPDWFKKWGPVLKEAMKEKWGFIPIDGMEADDAVGICATYYKDDYDVIIVASPDKDLKTIPNVQFYDYRKHTSEDIDELAAIKNLGTQVLKGDTGDNVKGLYDVGPRKSKSLIEPCKTPVEVKWVVARMYAGYESVLKKKAERTKLKAIKEEIEKSEWASGKNSKQIERKVRLKATNAIADYIEEKMPGGWKEYLKLQTKMLTILTEAPEGFDIPDPLEFEQPEVKAANDDFLYDLV